MRICVLYDCLFPYTVGGAERWYRNLALRLVADGHDVTYVTLRQWERGAPPTLAGVRVVEAGPRMALYGPDGNRRVLPPLVYGAGVLWHLLRHGRRYDVVHTASFPYFSVLAAGLLRRRGRYRLVVDWHEFWTREYWRGYLGRLGGPVGYGVQSRCLRIPQRAFCFSRLHRDRLRGAGFRGDPTVLEGEYDGALTPPSPTPRPSEPVAVFAGRHIPEKRAPAVVPAVARARRRIPVLRACIFGDGPEYQRVIEAIVSEHAEEFVEAPGFVATEHVETALRDALCMVLPSSREGYGLIVVEASARGCPSIVARGADNAAVELVEDGVNGVVAPSAGADDLADAIVRVWEGGDELRRSTCAWFERNAQRLSLGSSLDAVVASYARETASARA